MRFRSLERAEIVDEPVPLQHLNHVRVPAQSTVLRRNYFQPDPTAGGPEGFLVEMPGPCRTMAHFHDVDQFQLFFGQEGAWYHRHDLSALTLHYTDAYSTYGPFGCRSSERLRFFTLRVARSAVSGFMPENRDLLIRRGKRNYTVDVTAAGTKAGANGPSTYELIQREPDGLAAYVAEIGPGSSAVGPDRGARAGGRYYCVLRGSIEYEGFRFGVGSLGWSDFDEPPPVLTSGPGASVLIMQFPAHQRIPMTPTTSSPSVVVLTDER